MFDIGFPELMLVAVVVLLVLGPERLPEALRTAGLWIGRLQRSFNSVKTEIEREIGMDEIRRQLHNESVMAEMRKLEQDLKSNTDPRINGTLSSTASGDLDSNNILPEDSLSLGADAGTAPAGDAQEAPASSDEPSTTEAADTAPSASEPESEAATVERLQRDASLAAATGTDMKPANGQSGSDDEQRA
ncbi:MAG: Sec-independent protein translocase protein TatB [Pseudomonadota bacterium]